MPRPRRDYSAVTDYLEQTNRHAYCWVCGISTCLEYAHISGRIHDDASIHPLDIAVMCNAFANDCHGSYDRHDLDLVPFLTQAHIDRAKQLLGAGKAAIRLRGSRNPDELP